jgi:putative heme-binding domain-containing protein
MQQGIIVSQTSNAIIVNKQGGVKITISKKDIRSLKTLEMSPMPNDFEKRIDKQQMADLIAFIKQGE